MGLVGRYYDVSLQYDYQKNVFKGKIYLGTNMHPQYVVMDTGSNYVVIETTSCPTCVTNQSTGLYDYTANMGTSLTINLQKQGVNLDYGSASVGGFMVTDSMCARFNSLGCVTKLDMLLVT